MELESSVVRGPLPRLTGELGWGIRIANDEDNPGEHGRLSLYASLIEQNHETGVYVLGSDASIESTVVRDDLPTTRGGGLGVLAEDGLGNGVDGDVIERSMLVMKGSVLENNTHIGLYAHGASVTVDSSIVRTTRPDSTASLEAGVDHILQ
ncbi:hypothetical protein WMF30_40835 [Sorangium sp. So ce134]